MFFVHDLMDYAGRHTFLAKGFSDMGYDFYAADMRGHGKSDGMTGYIENIKMVANDLRSFMNKVFQTFYS